MGPEGVAVADGEGVALVPAMCVGRIMYTAEDAASALAKSSDIAWI
jgi:hypothetical protein